MFSEISITVKNDDKRLNKKYLSYAEYTISEEDPVIKECMEDTLKDFGETPDSIKVCIIMEIK